MSNSATTQGVDNGICNYVMRKQECHYAIFCNKIKIIASDNEILHLSQVQNHTLESDSHFAMQMD